MKITTEIMILKVGEIKQSKNGEPYFMLDFSDKRHSKNKGL